LARALTTVSSIVEVALGFGPWTLLAFVEAIAAEAGEADTQGGKGRDVEIGVRENRCGKIAVSVLQATQRNMRIQNLRTHFLFEEAR